MDKSSTAIVRAPLGTERLGVTAAANWRWALTALAIAVAAALPFALSKYHVFELTLVMIYAIAVLGLNILTGYNGQISLGHGGFFAAGAYTAAILMHRYGVPYWATLPPAGLICFVLGVLFGLPALRFEGPYLALVTLAMALATPQLLKYFDRWATGHQSHQADAAGRSWAEPGPLALSDRADRVVDRDPGRRQHAQRPYWPSLGGDPRSADRGRRHGDRHRAL
jgi:hypothetical protein